MRQVEELRRTLVHTLGSVIAAGEPVALVDMPDHRNPGDAAIALGAFRALRAVGADLAHVCTRDTYSHDTVAAAVRDGVVLLSGGGNLGDLYPWNQRFRERVIADFPRNRIVQLPQTAHFTSPERLEASRKAMHHEQLYLLLRDEASLHMAQASFDVPAQLCPDTAFGLGPITNRHAPHHDIVCLGRLDGEATGEIHRLEGPDLVHTDWPLAPADALRAGLRRLVGRTAKDEGSPVVPRSLERGFVRILPLLASASVRTATATIGRARVVITDRLHGHVLCLLLDVPHVVLDDRYGKVSAFFRTWNTGSTVAKLAEDPFQALELARSLVRA